MNRRSAKTVTKRSLRPNPPSGAPSQAEIQVGRKIKEARRARDLKLRELAERSDVSESLISKIENGKARPSISSLHRIAAALNINLSWFFNTEEQGEPRIVMRHGERKVLRYHAEGTASENFVPFGGTHMLQGFLITVEPGGRNKGMREHPGEEVGFLIEGQLELTVGGQSFLLNAGDSFNFRSEQPHNYYNPGKKPARLVWVNTPPTL
jgi:transcriptional regulator with XRE-family HTH domain